MKKFRIKFDAAVSAAGSAQKLADDLNVTESAVSQWKEQGQLPQLRSYQLAIIYPEKFADMVPKPSAA